MNDTNEMKIVFDSKSQNESFARVAVAVFVAQLDPNMEELSDIKTAVSEAVTNSIIHGYDGKQGKITLSCKIEERKITIVVEDNGCGMEDIEKAMEPLYTTKPELERSGMGFAFMEAFMDDLSVVSEVGKGTKVTMIRTIKGSGLKS
ncbi:MAG TPA: anti-sigma F factor [Lachnospiraceae bacterium]|mgnify:CR=1 FL=1|nr:anti-sigma F factor [uncultured Lachnoclostridium sp.]HAU88164.1 anti-sigma F factor [Lachnospiraceae bacterium]